LPPEVFVPQIDESKGRSAASRDSGDDEEAVGDAFTDKGIVV